MLPRICLLIFISAPAVAQLGSKLNNTSVAGVWLSTQNGVQSALILNPDKTGEFDGDAIQYVVKGNQLIIEQAGQSTTYSFVLKGNSLTLSGGDLDHAVTFTKSGSEAPATTPAPAAPAVTTPATPKAAPTSPKSAPAPPPGRPFLGKWSGNGETIEFLPEGTCNYLGQSYPYQHSAGYLTLTTGQGNIMMAYQVVGDELRLTVNGKLISYRRGAGANVGAAQHGQGTVAQELVGKWCYVNVNSTSSGGSSTSRCYTLNADGTYEYDGESSRSAQGYGGTASQSSDRGTWSVRGNTIFYTSQAYGSGSYEFQKVNHPKNGDPMIVINGEAFVTYYNKAPW